MGFFKNFWKKINTLKNIDISYAGGEPKSLLAAQDLEGKKRVRSKKTASRTRTQRRSVRKDDMYPMPTATATNTTTNTEETAVDPFAVSSEAQLPTLLQMRALGNMATSKTQKQIHKDETPHWRDEDLPSIREIAQDTIVGTETSTNQLTEKAEHTARWKRCVEHVQEVHPDVNAYAVCTAVLGDESFKSMDDEKFFDEIDKIIRHEGNKWKLYSHKGKLLGTHNTKAEAERQERAIMANKAQTIAHKQWMVRKAVIDAIDKFIKQQQVTAILDNGIAKFTKDTKKGMYHFTRTVTNKYYFDIEANNEKEAWELFEKMDNSEANGIKNLDVSSELEGFVPYNDSSSESF